MIVPLSFFFRHCSHCAESSDSDADVQSVGSDVNAATTSATAIGGGDNDVMSFRRLRQVIKLPHKFKDEQRPPDASQLAKKLKRKVCVPS